MDEIIFTTQFPATVPLAEYQWKDGERAIAASQLFQMQDLRLFCGVHANELTDVNGQHTQCSGIFDYLVCRRGRVLCALRVLERDEWRESCAKLPRLPEIAVTLDQISNGEVTEVLDALRNLGNEPSGWRCSLRRVPEALYAQLRSEKLLCRYGDDLEPTEYGRSCGIVKLMTAQGEAVPLWTRNTAARLTAPKEKAASEKAMAFSSRCSRIRKGLYCHDRNSADEVRAFMDTPLQDYMAEFPEARFALKSSLPEDCRTVGDAAQIISEQMLSGKEGRFDWATALLEQLAAPLIAYDKALAGMQAMPSGPAQCGDSRSHGEKQISFSKRTAFPQCMEPVAKKLCRMPMRRFLQGVSDLSGSGYPLWLGEVLTQMFELPAGFSYAQMLHLSERYMVRLAEEDDAQFSRNCRTGICLRYFMLVEPFLLIRDMQRQKLPQGA